MYTLKLTAHPQCAQTMFQATIYKGGKAYAKFSGEYKFPNAFLAQVIENYERGIAVIEYNGIKLEPAPEEVGDVVAEILGEMGGAPRKADLPGVVMMLAKDLYERVKYGDSQGEFTEAEVANLKLFVCQK